MSKIQERLNALRPYVVGIRYLQGIQLVDAVLKEGWTVPESKLIQRERVDGDDNYFMFFSDKEDIDIDDLLDYVQEIIDLNIEREKKFELLKLKVDELKKIFKDNSLTKLQRLRFSFSEPEILPTLKDMDDIGDDFYEESTELIDNDEKIEPVIEPKKVENKKQTNGKATPPVKFNDVELPPKGQKIELEEFKEPNVICKCGPNEFCPICEEEKDFAHQ